MTRGTLYIVATPIGNLEDITARALRTLREVDLIAAEDTRHTKKLLNHFGIETRLTSFFIGNENQKADALLSTLINGSSVAIVSDGGTPCISDPGFPIVRRAIENDIRVVPIPGPTAAATALCAAGLPTDKFTFVGFLSDKSGKRKTTLQGFASLPHTLVFYVSPWKVQKVLSDCVEVLGERDACLCRELTKIHEEFIRGTLSEISKIAEERTLKGEMVLLISAASDAGRTA
jgi:16S rRNA (cytidine1402-2'-O)-methyltransferase